MNRFQRKTGRKATAAPPPKGPGRRLPIGFLGVLATLVALSALIAYLIVQARTPATALSAADRAEADDSAELPGTYVPPQGGMHLSYQFTRSHTPVPYCEGVEWSGGAADSGSGTPTVAPSATPTVVDHTPVDGTAVPDNCYASNPPSSGAMLSGGRNVEVVPGALMDLPPEPNVYPRDVDIPREAIVHSLEHSGVFVGYNCAPDDAACWEVIDELEDLVNKRIDNNNDRVTMGFFSDLPTGQIGLSAWTRYDRFSYEEYDKKRAERFISTHSCRYDGEGFC